MSNITKTHKVGLFAMFIAAALIGSVIAISGDNMVFATKKKINESEQEIEQGQSNTQDGQCVSGVATLGGCNNVGLLFQNQKGNIVGAQQ
jgi:cell division protein FtsL